MIEDVLVASTAPGFSLPSIDLNRFCLTSSFSTIASMTTSARRDVSPLGSAIRRALAASRSALVLNLRANSLPLRGDALGDLLGGQVLQRHLHAGGDAPAGDVGAHGAGADHVHAQRLPAEALRRLRLQHLRQLEHAAQVARGVATPSAARRRASRRPSCLEVAAVRLEQVDQAERRGIVLLAHLLGGLVRAFSWPAARAPATCAAAASSAGAASTCACAATALRAAQRRARGSATSSSIRPMPRAALARSSSRSA